MKKIEKDYLEEYGEIPRDNIERLTYLLRVLNISKTKSKESVFDHINRISDIEWKEIKFVIFLEPKATPRPRCGRGRMIFYVSGAKDNRDMFKKFMDATKLEKIITPCKFDCMNYFKMPSGMNKIEKVLGELGYIRPISKPDWDNLGKTYSDMIQEQLLYDDSLIVDGRSRKFYSIKPRIEITIRYMESFDCKYNKLKIEKNLNKKNKENE